MVKLLGVVQQSHPAAAEWDLTCETTTHTHAHKHTYTKLKARAAEALKYKIHCRIQEREQRHSEP